MRQDIFFMPLGGGQGVGASCYYLRLGESNILLDAGVGYERGVMFEPDIHSLLTSPFLQSLNQINQIFISHAHTDHVGFLLKLLKEADRPSVYMTEMTALLTEYQLYDKSYMAGEKKAENERLAAQRMLEKVVNVSYMQTLKFGKYQVTFLPAGHIPGAMMALFEYGKKRILYTGDYSLSGTPLTGGCLIPEGLEIDTVILCGLHARHPRYQRKSDQLYQTLGYLFRMVTKRKQSVMCRVPQLSKGVELIKLINDWNTDHVPIYIDESIMPVVKKLEQSGIPILNKDNHVPGGRWPMEPHIFITSRTSNYGFGIYEEVKVDFSLHEDFWEMQEFIKKINPRQAYIVHCSKEYSSEDETIEQVMMNDSDCRTQFTFAREKEIYRL